MYGEDDWLEAAYEDRNGGDVDIEPDEMAELDLARRDDYMDEEDDDE